MDPLKDINGWNGTIVILLYGPYVDDDIRLSSPDEFDEFELAIMRIDVISFRVTRIAYTSP